ncbi:Gfo/Idh/MocA family protein [Martelella alba]|nr:Gfo/Idh/MocA family oxidoreductase [Martelella alba]
MMAVIGINHSHIYGQVDVMRAAGAELACYFAAEDHLAARFGETYPDVPRSDAVDRILEDPAIGLIISAAIPDQRVDIAIAAMRHGKDVLLDKPAATTVEDLERLKAVQKQTGRIVSVRYSEHLESRATIRAGELVRDGAIGSLVHMSGFGPHRLRRPTRDPWFFDRNAYGGILVDLASHQTEQFLFFTDSLNAEILSATVQNRTNPADPGLQDFGDIHMQNAVATGYARVDWLTPDGLPVWGDGRTFLVGTEGYIELRKHIDITGRPGKDHLFLSDRSETRYIDCSDVAISYGRDLMADISNRTETAMPQMRCFNAMALALEAQAIAERSLRHGME